jgi:hypothetical protein
MEDILPRQTFVSMNPDAAESVLPLDERTNVPSSSCKVRPAVTTLAWHTRYLPIHTNHVTSTAGFAHAEGSAALLLMRETVIDNDCALCGPSTGTLRRGSWSNDSSAFGSRRCSLRVITAKYASSCRVVWITVPARYVWNAKRIFVEVGGTTRH